MRKTWMILLTIGMLVFGAAIVSAQGGSGRGGNGNRGNGNNGNQNAVQVCDPESPEDCLTQSQQNAFNNGGIGFVNPQDGSQWNSNQRGKMNRGSGSNGTGVYTQLPPATVDTLPDDVVALIIDGWMDEQHAYAVYEEVINNFGEVAPFVSIQNAEAQHIAAWELLFDRYDIEAPAVPTFDVPQLASVSEACSAAADAEIANFALYDTMLETFVDYPDVYQIALALRNASEFNHLPAFESCAG